jgi:hypothetical protein
MLTTDPLAYWLVPLGLVVPPALAVTVSVWVLGAFCVKLAVIVTLLLILNVTELLELFTPAGAPVHPVNV